MRTTVKRAVSVKKDQDAEFKKLSKKKKVSYSALLQAAMDRYLKDESMKVMEESYAKYYGSQTSRELKEEQELIEDFQGMAAEVWPE